MPGTIIVPDHYSTIQQAVNAAIQGDTIFVRAGTYVENVLVNKNLSIIGENRTTTIVDGNNAGTVFYVNRSSVTIKGFTVTNSKLDHTGFFLYRSNNSVITENNVVQNQGGIIVLRSTNCTVNENLVENNPQRGIIFTNSQDFTASDNYIYGNKYGINANVSMNGLIAHNNVYESDFDGIGLQDGSKNITVVGNYVKSSVLGALGIWVESVNGSLIHHNNFVKTAGSSQVGLVPPSTNIWDNGLEGNYWSDYAGADGNQDGIGDTPYVIDGNNRDNYPLLGTSSDFSTSLGFNVNVISNSTVDDFQFFESNNTIRMPVSNASSTQLFGFVRMSISKGVISPPYNVTIDDGTTPILHFNGTIFDTYTNRWIYFAYPSSTHEVVIQGSEPIDIRAPTVTIISPRDRAYPKNVIPLTFTVSEQTDWIGYSLDGQANLTISGNVTLSGLSETTHTVRIYANDTVGNMGSSKIVYFIVDITFPTIEILLPENKTYTSSSILLNFTTSEATSWIGYSLDGQANVTIAGNLTLRELPSGSHSLIVYANDTAENTSSSNKVYFTIQVIPVDASPPSVLITSPKNETYETGDIALSIVVNESVSWMAYSLDNNPNVTITGNTTLSGLSTGGHAIIAYANDTAGNTGASGMVSFSVSSRQEPFPIWIAASIAAIVAVGAILLVYFTKFRRKGRNKFQSLPVEEEVSGRAKTKIVTLGFEFCHSL